MMSQVVVMFCVFNSSRFACEGSGAVESSSCRNCSRAGEDAPFAYIAAQHNRGLGERGEQGCKEGKRDEVETATTWGGEM